MKCYYEILSIPREADDGEIKSAYRKMALKFHPDKNLDNPEFAKEQFQLVQQAYEVLSDRQERAWYDNHREQILRGSNSEYKDNSLNVFQYFTTSCFKGYKDDENGFYTVYRKVFENLANEEIDHVDSKSDFDDIPTFGKSDSDYEEVVAPFYAFWMSFSTRKSYVWLDPYDIKEARERRLLKLIEKENKKVRQKAKKERNEEIRSLVAFVRKRDKRVQAYSKLLEKKNLENRQKNEEIRKQKIKERRMELNESNSQAEWSKFENLSSELKQIEKTLVEQFGEKMSDSEDEDEEDYVEDNLYCVACNKVFKNTKAFANHESSKKHKENLLKLKEEMLEEEGEDLEEECDIEEEEEQMEENDTASGEEEINTEESEDEIVEQQRPKKKTKNKKIIRTLDPFSHDENSGHSEGEAAAAATTKVEPKINFADDDDDEEDGFSSTKKQKNKKKKNNSKNPKPPATNNTINGETEETNISSKPTTIVTSNNVKKAKKNKGSRSRNVDVNSDEELNVEQVCVSCKLKFGSKNKLFEHLKKTGHSDALPHQNTTRQTKKGRRNIE